jgi:hypothetical protein
MRPDESIQSKEETIREDDGSVRTRTTETPSRRMEEKTSVSSTPSGEVTKHESFSGASPASAKEHTQKTQMFYLYKILWFFLGALEILLAFRFVLKFTGANPESGFADFVYGFSGFFVGPFVSLFQPTVGEGVETTAYFEWSTIIAAIVYGIIVWGIIKLINLARPVKEGEVDRTLQGQ